MAKGFSIRIFLPDGEPDGLRIVEKSNWTGRGLVCPRPLFVTKKDRPEFQKTGVYILIGPPIETELPRVYIGEGDPVRPRLESHAVKKDFWQFLVIFTSKDENMNKAHVQFLEAKLLRLAKEARRCDLDNGNQPELPSLSEADQADVEGFLQEMLLCLPVLGISVFEKPVAASPRQQRLFLNRKGLRAEGYESSRGMVVLKDSQAALHDAPSLEKHVKGVALLRKTLIERGLLVAQNGCYVLTQDYEFTSPSTAAAVILGSSSNGRTDWMDAQGRTLKEIQGAGG